MSETVKSIIQPLLGNDSETLDSLKVLQLVMALDEAGYTIPMEKIASIRTVEDLVALAESSRS